MTSIAQEAFKITVAVNGLGPRNESVSSGDNPQSPFQWSNTAELTTALEVISIFLLVVFILAGAKVIKHKLYKQPKDGDTV